MRGIDLRSQKLAAVTTAYPACVGIDLDKMEADLFGDGLPRMRGDRHPRHVHGGGTPQCFTRM